MSNTELDRARERIGTLREEKGDREFVAAHASKGAIPRKEIEALRWLISQRFVVPESDNVQFALVLSLLQRLSQRPTPATASEPRTMPQDAEFAPAIATEIEDKPDSASTGKPLYERCRRNAKGAMRVMGFNFSIRQLETLVPLNLPAICPHCQKEFVTADSRHGERA